MKTRLIKYLFIICNKTSIMVGGQAVMEGVMMRVPGAYATAIRNSSGDIEINYNQFKSYVEKYKLQNIPVLRGFVHLIDSMKIGFSTLEWSSTFIEENTKSTNKFVDLLLTIFSIGFAVSLFMGIPYYITEKGLLYFALNENNDFIFNLIAGCSRIFIFILYLYLISKLKDIKRLFQYHGAEHKVVYNFESGKPINISNAKTFSTKHPRCGTSFVFILMMVTILSYGIVDTSLSIIFNINFMIWQRILVHLICLPLVAGIGYEVLKFFAKHQTLFLFRILSKPGLWLQNITTNEPDEKQLEVSIAALDSAFNNDIAKFQGKQFKADAIG